MTAEQRRSADNGIWLCATCATEIDKDPERFPVATLRQWKVDAEQEALRMLQRPISRLGIAPPGEAVGDALQEFINEGRVRIRENVLELT